MDSKKNVCNDWKRPKPNIPETINSYFSPTSNPKYINLENPDFNKNTISPFPLYFKKQSDKSVKPLFTTFKVQNYIDKKCIQSDYIVKYESQSDQIENVENRTRNQNLQGFSPKVIVGQSQLKNFEFDLQNDDNRSIKKEHPHFDPQLHQITKQKTSNHDNSKDLYIEEDEQPDSKKNTLPNNEYFQIPARKKTSNITQSISESKNETSFTFRAQKLNENHHNDIKKDQKLKTCSCRRSKCLKLYCDCLANGEYCDPSCLCLQCRNLEIYNNERNEAIYTIVKKNPDALNSKLVLRQYQQKNRQNIQKQVIRDCGCGKNYCYVDNKDCMFQKLKKNQDSNFAHSKGCNCIRSQCTKKYCECYESGIFCGQNCNCRNCLNTRNNIDPKIIDKFNSIIQKQNTDTIKTEF